MSLYEMCVTSCKSLSFLIWKLPFMYSLFYFPIQFLEKKMSFFRCKQRSIHFVLNEESDWILVMDSQIFVHHKRQHKSADYFLMLIDKPFGHLMVFSRCHLFLLSIDIKLILSMSRHQIYSQKKSLYTSCLFFFKFI